MLELEKLKLNYFADFEIFFQLNFKECILVRPLLFVTQLAKIYSKSEK